MSYAQNIFTTTSPNETDFVITWTPPYYMTTADVKAEVDKVAWTVVSVSGTNVTLATGIPVDSTVRIYRETDVSSNEVDFLAGSPFRAGDVNENFNQTLFAVQEALTSDENHEADIDRLEGLIDTILALLNNNIQFVQVANVAALDTVAATDPENLKGYEVVDSTGLEGANPEIPLMPPKAGTGTGEDPVTGVYWDSGISTKVLWDKANQNWIYVSYFASNGDNRYQQITLQQATAPNVADFKNGTLWFNTTDQNLYVLYDDSSTRSWVLVGPLRDDRYVNRTGDSMTGDLLMNNANVVFEGSTDDGFETTLTVTDPTADNSIVLPDVSGNVVTTGDTGTVTSTMISDGTIVDADVNASAAIGLSKLATGALPTGITVASANIVDGTIVNADINSSAAIDLTKLGSGALPSNITVNSDNITNLSIVNDDVNANAEIEVSKLANGTARQLLQTDAAGTGVEFTSNVDVPGTLDVTSTAVFDSNVGIGTPSPRAKAEVYDSSVSGAFVPTTLSTWRVLQVRNNIESNTGTAAGIAFGGDGSSDTETAGIVGISSNSTGGVCELALLYASGNASKEGLRLDSSGNVGIGTASASSFDSEANNLVVGDGTGDNGITIFTGTAAGNHGSIFFADGTGSSGAKKKGQIRYEQNNEVMSFHTNEQERLRIDLSGNVGIGKTTLNTTFEIYNATQPYIYLQNSTTGTGASDGFSILEFGLDAYINNREAGNMLFYNNGSERMRINSSGRLLLGTTNEGHADADNLTIADTLKTGITIRNTNVAGDGAIFFSDDGTGTGEYSGFIEYGHSGDYMRFATASTERMRIDSSGRVGINNSSPAATLSVDALAGNSTVCLLKSPTVNAFLQLGNSSNDQGYLGYQSSNLTFYTAGSERMRIDSSGNVGIGSSDPTGDGWSAANNLVINSTGNSGMTIKSGTSSFGQLVFNDAAGGLRGFIAYGHSDDYLGFGTSGAERMRINNSGGIDFLGAVASGYTTGALIFSGGRIASYVSNSTTGTDPRLYVYNGTTSSYPARINANGTAEFAGRITIGSASSYPLEGLNVNTSSSAGTGAVGIASRNFTAGGVNYAGVNAAGTRTFSVSDAGAGVFAGTVSAQGSVLTSDQRFKENITDANPQLADVTELGKQLRNWDWTDDAPVADKETRFLGLVAQDVETVCPGLVTTISRTKQGKELTPETTDEEGNVTPATYEQLDDSYKAIKNDVLVMKLLGAVAELSAEIEALKA